MGWARRFRSTTCSPKGWTGGPPKRPQQRGGSGRGGLTPLAFLHEPASLLFVRMQRATARWAGQKVKFVVESGSGHQAAVDEPPVLGQDEGMRPTEMLLGALGACTGINAVLLLKKFRQAYRGLAVECEGQQQDDWPHAFTDVEIRFVIDW